MAQIKYYPVLSLCVSKNRGIDHVITLFRYLPGWNDYHSFLETIELENYYNYFCLFNYFNSASLTFIDLYLVNYVCIFVVVLQIYLLLLFINVLISVFVIDD